MIGFTVFVFIFYVSHGFDQKDCSYNQYNHCKYLIGVVSCRGGGGSLLSLSIVLEVLE